MALLLLLLLLLLMLLLVLLLPGQINFGNSATWGVLVSILYWGSAINGSYIFMEDIETT